MNACFFFLCKLLLKAKKQKLYKKSVTSYNTLNNDLWPHYLFFLFFLVNNCLSTFCFNSLLFTFNMHALLSNPGWSWNKRPESWHSLSQEASAVPMSPGVLPGATGPVFREQVGGGGGLGRSSANNHTSFHPPSPDALWAPSNACSSLKSIAAPGAKKPHVNPGLSDRQMSLWAKA